MSAHHTHSRYVSCTCVCTYSRRGAPWLPPWLPRPASSRRQLPRHTRHTWRRARPPPHRRRSRRPPGTRPRPWSIAERQACPPACLPACPACLPQPRLANLAVGRERAACLPATEGAQPRLGSPRRDRATRRRGGAGHAPPAGPDTARPAGRRRSPAAPCLCGVSAARRAQLRHGCRPGALSAAATCAATWHDPGAWPTVRRGARRPSGRPWPRYRVYSYDGTQRWWGRGGTGGRTGAFEPRRPHHPRESVRPSGRPPGHGRGCRGRQDRRTAVATAAAMAMARRGAAAAAATATAGDTDPPTDQPTDGVPPGRVAHGPAAAGKLYSPPDATPRRRTAASRHGAERPCDGDGRGAGWGRRRRRRAPRATRRAKRTSPYGARRGADGRGAASRAHGRPAGRQRQRQPASQRTAAARRDRPTGGGAPCGRAVGRPATRGPCTALPPDGASATAGRQVRQVGARRTSDGRAARVRPGPRKKPGGGAVRCGAGAVRCGAPMRCGALRRRAARCGLGRPAAAVSAAAVGAPRPTDALDARGHRPPPPPPPPPPPHRAAPRPSVQGPGRSGRQAGKRARADWLGEPTPATTARRRRGSAWGRPARVHAAVP